MDNETRLIFLIDEIGAAILAEKERERKLYYGYKALNPDIPDDDRDQAHFGIMEGLDRAFQAFIAAHKKYGYGK